QKERRPMAIATFEALVTTVVGSSNTPARNDASCSTGGCVGPSSPITHGVVCKDENGRQLHKGRETDGWSCIVAKDEKVASKARSLDCDNPFTIAAIPCSRMPKCRFFPLGLSD